MCQAAEANYAKAARELKTHDPPILLAKLDGSLEGHEILQKYVTFVLVSKMEPRTKGKDLVTWRGRNHCKSVFGQTGMKRREAYPLPTVQGKALGVRILDTRTADSARQAGRVPPGPRDTAKVRDQLNLEDFFFFFVPPSACCCSFCMIL